MSRRQLQFAFLPGQGEAVGVSHLLHPHLHLWTQAKRRFMRQALQLISHGVEPTHLDDVLEECGFGTDAISLDEWFQHYPAPPVPLDWTSQGLAKLADLAEDLTRDGGLWKERAADLACAERDALEEFQRRLAEMQRRIAFRFGPGSTGPAIAGVRRKFETTAKTWAVAQPWTSQRSDELRQAAHTLRSYANPRGLAGRTLRRLRPGVDAKWWLSEGQRRNVERKLLPAIIKGIQLRFAQETDRCRRRVAEALLGRPGVQGVFDLFLAEAMSQGEYFQELDGAIATNHPELVYGPNTLCTATSLDVLLDPAGQRSLGDLIAEALAKAGCSTREFAAQMHDRGLLIDGRERLPVEWPHLPVPTVLTALHDAIDHYLGSDDLDAPLQIDEPQTAFDYAAAITLCHPELEPLVKNLLPGVVDRSRPFAEINDVSGRQPVVHKLLYCFPPHRPRWERMLQTNFVPLANPNSVAANADAYQLCHPYQITLVQFATLVPLGALRSLPVWVRQSNLQQKKGTLPMFDVNTMPETRRLPERPSDEQNSRELFEAAAKAHVVVSVTKQSPSRYTLAIADSRLDTVFTEGRAVPTWKTATEVHQAIQRVDFRNWLDIACPEVADLRVTLERLAREEEPQRITSALVELGLFETDAGGRIFRLRCTDAALSAPGFFHREQGVTRGLTPTDFVAELLRNDDLYNTVFWRVCDALDLGRLSPNDVPVFLRDFMNTL